jgi:hypothetical protein
LGRGFHCYCAVRLELGNVKILFVSLADLVVSGPYTDGALRKLPYFENVVRKTGCASARDWTKVTQRCASSWHSEVRSSANRLAKFVPASTHRVIQHIAPSHRSLIHTLLTYWESLLITFNTKITHLGDVPCSSQE